VPIDVEIRFVMWEMMTMEQGSTAADARSSSPFWETGELIQQMSH